ncbi:MAG TPA: ATP-dependent Clp protease adaptor ClpS [Phycisphaerae bacterium]|nr:ATP-dependent Clp protease adaptor ClpS [Phycisphaerae bacterium]
MASVYGENDDANVPAEPSRTDGSEVETGVAEPATQTAPPKMQPKRPKPRQLPPFKVLLHNDDVNDFEHVIRAIIKLTPLSLEEAFQKTLEAHETGVSLLLVTHQERAELYSEQFATMSLTVTIEPDA